MKVWVAGGWALGGALLGAALVWTLVVPKAPDPDGGDKAASAEKAEKPGQGLVVDARTQAQAGIRIAPVTAARSTAARSGFARAIDLSPLAALASDAETARAAVAASQKEVTRLTALTAQDQSAAPKDLEAAQAQLVSDRSKLTLACQKIGLDFGAGLMRVGCDGITGLARDAAQGRAALVRIDMTEGLPPSGGTLTIGEGTDAAVAQILGPAANADPQLQAAGMLALVRGPAAARLAVGRVLPVHLAAGASTGVLVPRSALVRADGGQFVYRALGGGRFARVALDGGAPLDSGWFFAGSALKPGDPIVVSGATTLLGLERGPQQAGDD